MRSGRQGDRNAPRGSEGALRTRPHLNGGYTRAPPVSRGRRGIGAPRGGMGAILRYPNPYSGVYARFPPVCPGSRGTGTPVGPEGMVPPNPTQRRLHSGPPGSARTTRGWRPTRPLRRSLCGGSWSRNSFGSGARRAAPAAPTSPPAGGQGKVAVGGSAPDTRSVLPPSIAEGGVRGAEVPPSLQDTENAQ